MKMKMISVRLKGHVRVFGCLFCGGVSGRQLDVHGAGGHKVVALEKGETVSWQYASGCSVVWKGPF